MHYLWQEICQIAGPVWPVSGRSTEKLFYNKWMFGGQIRVVEAMPDQTSYNHRYTEILSHILVNLLILTTPIGGSSSKLPIIWDGS